MPEPVTEDDLEGEGVILVPTRSIEEILSQHISRLEHRIRELEEMTNVYVNLHTGALGSLTQQTVALMESHTETL